MSSIKITNIYDDLCKKFVFTARLIRAESPHNGVNNPSIKLFYLRHHILNHIEKFMNKKSILP
jgi:hypothetical protein